MARPRAAGRSHRGPRPVSKFDTTRCCSLSARASTPAQARGHDRRHLRGGRGGVPRWTGRDPRPNQSPIDSVRITDTRLVLDELTRLASGTNPDAEHRALPNGLSTALDLAKVGMFGHSLGGATAAKAMAADARISAGINLDGSTFLANPALHQNISKLAAQLAEQLGDRAFMTMTHQGHDTHSDPSLAGFWSHLRGWRLFSP